MELEQAKKLLENRTTERRRLLERVSVCERYYKCKNDILKKTPPQPEGHPYRRACHRIPSNFFKVLVDQKAAYMFGVPPVFDIGTKAANDALKEALGEQWSKNCKRLCREFSVAGEAWIQYWSDEDGFHYGVVTDWNFEPVWAGTLGEELALGVRYALNWIDPATGEAWDTYEIWDSARCYAFKKPSDSGPGFDGLRPDYRWPAPKPEVEPYVNPEMDKDSVDVMTNVFEHGYGEVPFIRFRNNDFGMSDLVGIKELIDAYDEAVSGLADDITDSEEIIFVLSGYGGQDAGEFWEKVNKNRLIKLIDDPLTIANGGGHADLKTLAVEPPLAARQFSIETNRQGIFEAGGGVDPHQQDVPANTSGEALKHTYSQLELKAVAAEDECRIGFARLVRAVCRLTGLPMPKDGHVTQTWKRTRINNDTELVNNIRSSVGILSNRTLLENHPMVTDVEEELRRKEQERREAERRLEEDVARGLMNEKAKEGNDAEGQGGGDSKDKAKGSGVLG